MSSPTRLHNIIRFYRYKKGDFFNWHKDGALKEDREKSLVTFMVYLTDVGVTEFQFVKDGPIVTVESKQGRMVIFNHKINHRSPPLEDGIKISCRTDVMYKLNLPGWK